MPDQVVGASAPGEPDGKEPPDASNDSSAPDGKSQIQVGCADLPPGLRRARYFERLRYLEIEGTLHGLPKPSVITRWAAEIGSDGRLGLLAPEVISHNPGPRGYPRMKVALLPEELAQAGAFRSTPVVSQAVEALARVTTALRAEVVLFRSPADFSPSASHRDTLRHFFTEMARADLFGETLRVWEPQGLWEPEVAARLAGDMGVVYACDPLSNDPLALDRAFYASLPHSCAYFRLAGLGRAHHRFDEHAMTELCDLADGYDRTFIVFAHAARYPDALRLQKMLGS